MSVITLSIERRDEMRTVSRLRIALATFNRASPLKPVCKSCRPPTTNEMGVPPALPGRQSNFENSGSIPPAVAFVFAEARCLASLVPLQLLLLFTGCDQAPLRGQQP